MKKKINVELLKRILILIMIITLTGIFNNVLSFIFLGKTNNLFDKKVLAGDDNDASLYVFYWDSWNRPTIKNKFNETNPYITYVGEETVFFAGYETHEKYLENKETICSDLLNNSGNILEKTIQDIWDDGENRMAFAYTARNPGTSTVIIREKDDPYTTIETLPVRVYRPNKIYVANGNNRSENPHNMTLTVGDEIVLEAVFDGNLNMNGNQPSVQQNYGSGFWSWDAVTVQNEWTKLDNGSWLQRSTCRVNAVGQQKVSLAKNGTAAVDEITFNVEPPNNIKIRNMKMAANTFTNVNKNTATQMLNGKNTGLNSDSNRYIVYVGDKLELSAIDSSGLHLEVSDQQFLSTVQDSYEDGSTVKATYRGLHPGNVEVNLKDDSGTIKETLYVSVKYPINVVSSIKELNKDTLHEYIDTDTVMRNIYNSYPQGFVSDDHLVPQWIKNGENERFSYHLCRFDTVVLCTYTKDDDDTTMTLTDGLEFVPIKDHNYNGSDNYVVSEQLSGDLQGYKRISAEIKVNSTNGSESVTFGNEIFYITVKPSTDYVHHFDFEIADGGSYTLVETDTTPEGNRKITKTIYNAYTREIHGSEVFDRDGNTLITLQESEYWQNHGENETQFESTSAYVTNENGNLIDSNGNVIDDEVRAGTIIPQIAVRNVPFSEIEKVVFNADLHIVPLQRNVTILDDDGNIVDSYSSDGSNIEEEFLNNVEIVMGPRDIIDALNKCPSHGGLDFTAKIIMNIEHKVGNINVSKEVENKKGDEEFSFKITITNDDGSINTDINGVYGDLEFINGVARFTLKDGENKLILNLPAGMNYTVEETDSQGYTIVSEGEIGSVEPDETVYVKFKNIGEDEPEPEEPTPDEPEPEKPDDAEEYNDEKPEPKDESKNPKTSDEIIINFVSLAMSLGIVLALIKHTSKNKRNTSKYIIW